MKKKIKLYSHCSFIDRSDFMTVLAFIEITALTRGYEYVFIEIFGSSEDAGFLKGSSFNLQ